MKKFEQHKVLPRYTFFVVLMTLVAMAVVGKSAYTMTAKKKYWSKVADRQTKDSVRVAPTRGNILSCDGRLLASTLPEYMLFVDFKAMADTKTDTLWAEKEDSICEGLNRIFPSQSTEAFRAHLREGKEKLSQHWNIWPQKVNYETYLQVKALPIFNRPKNKSGFHYDKFESRVHPNGSLAARTIGEINVWDDSPKCGLELTYDSLLRGTDGLKHRRKVLNRYLDIIDVPATDGADIVTTIDIGMQDVAEKSLLDMLKRPEVNGEMGVAIVMEVETGDVKAIVNLSKCDDGEYYEIINNAVGYTCEPGSVFKTASILAAIDDDKVHVDTAQWIETGNGIRDMYGAKMKDHNWANGGYGTINLAKAMEKSSNVGISVAIDNAYRGHPEWFVDALDRVGIRDSLPIPIHGYHKPNIRYPKQKANGNYAFDAKTTLPWMSIGYETMIAPINTLTFYNAIANNGKMVAPRFVKQIVKNGEVIEEFDPIVMRENICRHPESIKTMQTVLEHVVSRGTGKPAKPENFPAAGKTGTAQVSHGKEGYKNGVVGYWLSFAGYFPADKPRYSCIVCIKKWGAPASGGLMSGVVFKNIAEGIMSQFIKKETTSETGSPLPEVKPGNILAADYVLSNLGIRDYTGWTNTFATGSPIWGKATNSGNLVTLSETNKTAKNIVPDVIGMGARDAVYLLENRGLKVNIIGRGKVVSQSLAAGSGITKGQVCLLELDVSGRHKKDTIPNTTPAAATVPSQQQLAKGQTQHNATNKKV